MINLKRIFFVLIPLFFISCFNDTRESLITYNIAIKPETFNPKLVRDVVSIQVNSMINEGLLHYDEDKNEYFGALADSFIEDKNILKFKIKDNVYWSNGKKITIDDFIYGFKLALDKEVASQYADMLFSIKNSQKFNKGEIPFEEVGVYKENDYLVIELEKNIPYFKYILTLPISYPINKEFYDEYKDEYGIDKDKVLYSGQFKIKEMDDSKILLEKNKDYYSNLSNLENIKLIFINNFDVVDKLIKNGELDITRVEHKKLEDYKKENKIKTYYNGRIWYLEYNFNNLLANNLNFRKAINTLINRDEYVNEIKKDGSKVAKSLVSDIIYGYKDKFRNEYKDDNYFSYNDIEKSKYYFELAMKETNLTIDKINNMKLRFLIGNSEPEKIEGEYLQEQIRKVLGINLEVLSVPFKERLALTRAKDFFITLNTWSPKYSDISAVLVRWNKEEYANSKKLFDRAMNEDDLLIRSQIFAEMEKDMIDNVLVSPLYFSIENWYMNPKIKNIKILPISNLLDFKEAKIK